jgi:hypothetical protein
MVTAMFISVKLTDQITAVVKEAKMPINASFWLAGTELWFLSLLNSQIPTTIVTAPATIVAVTGCPD